MVESGKVSSGVLAILVSVWREEYARMEDGAPQAMRRRRAVREEEATLQVARGGGGGWGGRDNGLDGAGNKSA